MTEPTPARPGTRTRTHTWVPPVPPQDVAELSGEEFLRAIIEGRLPHPPFSGTMGIYIRDVKPGWAAFEGEPGEHLYNPLGTVHGGFLATLLDSALGCAVMTVLPPGTGYTTVQLNVNMVRAVTADTGTLHCEANAVHTGRTIGTAEARVVGAQDGRLYAHATTTCAIFPLKRDRQG